MSVSELMRYICAELDAIGTEVMDDPSDAGWGPVYPRRVPGVEAGDTLTIADIDLTPSGRADLVDAALAGEAIPAWGGGMAVACRVIAVGADGVVVVVDESRMLRDADMLARTTHALRGVCQIQPLLAAGIPTTAALGVGPCHRDACP